MYTVIEDDGKSKTVFKHITRLNSVNQLKAERACSRIKGEYCKIVFVQWEDSVDLWLIDHIRGINDLVRYYEDHIGLSGFDFTDFEVVSLHHDKPIKVNGEYSGDICIEETDLIKCSECPSRINVEEDNFYVCPVCEVPLCEACGEIVEGLEDHYCPKHALEKKIQKQVTDVADDITMWLKNHA